MSLTLVEKIEVAALFHVFYSNPVVAYNAILRIFLHHVWLRSKHLKDGWIQCFGPLLFAAYQFPFPKPTTICKMHAFKCLACLPNIANHHFWSDSETISRSTYSRDCIYAFCHKHVLSFLHIATRALFQKTRKLYQSQKRVHIPTDTLYLDQHNFDRCKYM